MTRYLQGNRAVIYYYKSWQSPLLGQSNPNTSQAEGMKQWQLFWVDFATRAGPPVIQVSLGTWRASSAILRLLSENISQKEVSSFFPFFSILRELALALVYWATPHIHAMAIKVDQKFARPKAFRAPSSNKPGLYAVSEGQKQE